MIYSNRKSFRIITFLTVISIIMSTFFSSVAYATEENSDILDTVSLLDGTTITENTIISDGTVISTSCVIIGSSDPSNPVTVTLEGNVTAECSIKISGHVKISGGTILRSHSESLFLFDSAATDSQLTVENCVIDGQEISSTETFFVEGTDADFPNILILSGNTEIKNEKCSDAVINFEATVLNLSKYGQTQLHIRDNVKIHSNEAPYIISNYVDALWVFRGHPSVYI